MRLTFSDIKSAHLRNIGQVGSTDTTVLSDFQYNLGQRYQLTFGMLTSYINDQSSTTDTVAAQQYYYYPPGVVSVDDAVVTIGSVKYPVTTIYDQYTWDTINAIPIQASVFPKFIYPRKSDFGIWPIPQDAYTLTFNSYMRDRNLMVEDYTDGTVSVTAGNATITGTTTNWTPAMVGRWFTITDTSVPGQGYWYRVRTYSSPTSLVLDTYWNGSTASGKAYRIGETPEVPEEAHVIFAAGTTADYYAGLRGDTTRASWYDNVFWTGSGKNDLRDIGNPNIKSGLIGLVNRYEGRDRRTLIKKQPPMGGYYDKLWSSRLS